jgi:hypothetical protein
MLHGLGHLRNCFRGRLPALLLTLSLAGMPAAAKSAAPKKNVESLPALLPTSFGGWQQMAPPQLSSQPQAADPANADVLAECGFQEFEASNYSTADNHLNLRAIRFQDATGAYSAFTFYRRPASVAEEIGRTAAWDGSHVLFWQGATLVDATFDHVTGMSAAELRELAGDLPKPAGSENIAPSLPVYLPHTDLNAELIHYALGTQTYVRAGGVLPPSLIDFSGSSAEAVTATYSTRDGDGKLTLLEYPTPQLAAARVTAIDAFLKAGNTPQAAWSQELAESHPDTLLTRRSGPIVAITNGTFPASTARQLLDQINYQAEVIPNNPEGYVGEGSKVANLLIGIIELFAILGGSAILLGIFLGGGRAIIRVLRGKPASALDEETEFIRLKLDE